SAARRRSRSFPARGSDPGLFRHSKRSDAKPFPEGRLLPSHGYPDHAIGFHPDKHAQNASHLVKSRNKVRIVNLGCSKNQVDSENILGEFGRAGFSLAQEGDASQVTVINTCGFIEAAKEESIQEILGAIQA